MQIKSSILLALAATPFASGVTLATLTFEADENGFFSFANTAGSVETIQVISGTGGTDGIATRVNSNPGTFAGGGIGDANNPFNLSAAGVMGGAVTESIFDSITGSLDVNMPVGQQISIRIEPGNGGFPERADLGVTIDGTGDFQTVNFDTSGVDAGQRTTFINTLNDGDATGLKFVFQINNQGSAVGSDFVFDNLSLSADAVPEPSSALLALFGAGAFLRRRR